MVADALGMIESQYIDPIDSRKLLTSALAGMTDSLDPYSEFVEVERYERLQTDMDQEFVGVGIIIEKPDEVSPVRVVTPIVGSPALRAGMRAGDEFMEIDGEPVAAEDVTQVSARLKGPIGSPVRVRIRRGDQSVDLSIVRGMIEVESVVGDYRGPDDQWVYRLKDDPSIAYARLTTFGAKTPEELRDVVGRLVEQASDGRPVAAFVLDLRSNGGGLLETAVSVSDLFLSGGEVVKTVIRGGVVEQRFLAGPKTLLPPTVPMAVLIDGNSASASEIVAAALQDRGRAIVVGERSFGKGTVQKVLPLETGRSALKLTVARYVRPSGANIHRIEDADETEVWGVSPSDGGEVGMSSDQWIRLVNHWRRQTLPASSRDSADAIAIVTVDPIDDTPEPTSEADRDPNSESKPPKNPKAFSKKSGDNAFKIVDPSSDVTETDSSEDDLSVDDLSDVDPTNGEPGGVLDPVLERAIELLRQTESNSGDGGATLRGTAA